MHNSCIAVVLCSIAVMATGQLLLVHGPELTPQHSHIWLPQLLLADSGRDVAVSRCNYLKDIFQGSHFPVSSCYAHDKISVIYLVT